MRREQGALLRKIQDIEKATPAPIDQAIDMLGVTSRASELFRQQAPLEQRKLLQTVVEKAAWKGGPLEMTLFEPFELLRHSNQESYGRQKEKGSSDSGKEIWLLKPYSNFNPQVNRGERTTSPEKECSFGSFLLSWANLSKDANSHLNSVIITQDESPGSRVGPMSSAACCLLMR
jgi:hypothetical protein